MIRVGIDDTDTLETRGTNHLARLIVERLGLAAPDGAIVRHQLLFDRRIPYTSHNGSASIALPSADPARASDLARDVRMILRECFVEGSDPGLCVAADVPDAIRAFGRRCQREIVTMDDARALAAAHGIHLEGLGGTSGGIIGALAAVGLAAAGEDGRVVHWPGWPWPDPLSGVVPIETLRARGVEEVRDEASGAVVTEGLVDVGKRLRPNVRGGKMVVLVEKSADDRAPHRALRLH